MAASRQDSHLLFWPSLAEACVWLSKDPVWSCSSLGRHCLRAEPESSKVSGSVRGPYPRLAPCGPRGNIYLLKSCYSLGILVPLPTKKRKGESGFGLLCTGNSLSLSSGILMSCSGTGACLRLTIGEIILSPADLPLGPVSCLVLSNLGTVFPRCWVQWPSGGANVACMLSANSGLKSLQF